MHSPGRRAVLGQADQKEGGIALISLVELRYQFLAKVVMGNGRISQVRQPENRRYTVYPRKLVLEGKQAQSGWPRTTTAARSAYRDSRSSTSYPRTDSKLVGRYFSRSYSTRMFSVPYTEGTSKIAAATRIAILCRTVNRGIELTRPRSRTLERKSQPRPPQVLKRSVAV